MFDPLPTVRRSVPFAEDSPVERSGYDQVRVDDGVRASAATHQEEDSPLFQRHRRRANRTARTIPAACSPP